MKITAIGHQKGVGKSTFAKNMVTALRIAEPGARVCVKSFASGIKRVSFDLFSYLGLKDEAFYEANYKLKEFALPCGWTPRDIWIHVGNTMREVDGSVWAHDTVNADCDFLIITDLRFPIEVHAVTDAGGQCIKINRDVERGSDAAETELLDFVGWDAIIENNQGLSNLYLKAEKWIKS